MFVNFVIKYNNVPKPYKKKRGRDFPGGPVVKTLSFHCRGHGFNPCLGN